MGVSYKCTSHIFFLALGCTSTHSPLGYAYEFNVYINPNLTVTTRPSGVFDPNLF